ncbi:MAG: hypothetical protein IJM81_02735 [Prevotella sp.]|nr:hypothetical protein [Prevotella sp.]
MIRLVHIVLAGLLLTHLVGCGPTPNPSQKERAESVMRTADSLMRTRPDSALKLLYSIAPASPQASLDLHPALTGRGVSDKLPLPNTSPLPLGGAGGGLEAYYLLLLLDAQNKCDTVFSSDTLQRALVRYYDRHGTPNERMRAYYLLGRACHDMGEAPRALDCYQQAVDCADTTSADCDYYRLCRVYSQMAAISHQQLLFENEMEYRKAAERYAWLAKDTLGALQNYELRLRPYYFQNKRDSVIYITKMSAKLYEKYGYKSNVAQVLPAAIDILLDHKQYEEAGRCITKYERESNLFDKSGNIASGKEMFYFLKGRYLMATGKVDSATVYFRKTLSAGYDEAAYKGLLSVYEKKGNADSIAKYARLFVDANDSAFLQKNSEEVHRISALYKYERSQRAAAKAEKKLEITKRENALILVTSIFMLSLMIGVGFYKYNKEKKASLHRINVLARSYTSMVDELNLRRLEMKLLTKNQALMTEQQMQIDTYLQQIDGLKTQLHQKTEKELANAFFCSDIYELAKEIVTPSKGKPQQRMNRRNWKDFEKNFHIHFPQFSSFMKEYCLTESQIRVCMLIRANFSEAEMCILMEKPSDAINRIKVQLNTKLFNDKHSKTLRTNLKTYF